MQRLLGGGGLLVGGSLGGWGPMLGLLVRQGAIFLAGLELSLLVLLCLPLAMGGSCGGPADPQSGWMTELPSRQISSICYPLRVLGALTAAAPVRVLVCE